MKGQQTHYIQAMFLLNSIDHSLTRIKSTLKLCEWKNVVKCSSELWITEDSNQSKPT